MLCIYIFQNYIHIFRLFHHLLTHSHTRLDSTRSFHWIRPHLHHKPTKPPVSYKCSWMKIYIIIIILMLDNSRVDFDQFIVVAFSQFDNSGRKSGSRAPRRDGSWELFLEAVYSCSTQRTRNILLQNEVNVETLVHSVSHSVPEKSFHFR